MNLKWNKTALLFLECVFLFSIACSANKKFDANFYSAENTEKLKQHLSTLKSDYKEAANHVFLVVHETQCLSCTEELGWWQTSHEDLKPVRVSLIVVDKYTVAAERYLESKEFTMDYAVDNTDTFIIQKLLPVIPIKLYFDADGRLARLDNIGTDGDLDGFLKVIRKEMN